MTRKERVHVRTSALVLYDSRSPSYFASFISYQMDGRNLNRLLSGRSSMADEQVERRGFSNEGGEEKACTWSNPSD